METNLDIQIEEIKHSFGAKITVIGVGGGGSNMINNLVSCGAHSEIKIIAANTDIQHLESSSARVKIKLGEKATRGLGAGMVPEKGKEAAIESYDEIKDALVGSDIVFISTGLGGGTGTGASPIVAKAAREVGALTVSVVTKPFKHEGNKRARLAEEGLKELKNESDSIVVIPNDKLLSVISKSAGIKESFKMVDDVLARAVNGISSVILKHGANDMNVDFADVRTVMNHKGLALMGIGEASGENSAIEAVKQAIASPLFDNISINGAMGVLVNFEVNENFSLSELSEAMELVNDCAHDDADVIWGTITNDEFSGVKVTIVATGFEREMIKEDNKLNEEALKASARAINTGLLASGGDFFNDNDLEVPTIFRHQKD